MDLVLQKLVDESFDSMVADIQKSIRIESVLKEENITEKDPFGSNVTAALTSFLENAEKMGFKTGNVDNYAGYVDLGDKGELVGILAHLDVVPEGKHELWDVPPYSATIIDGKLYGRGSADDKGPAFAALYAMKALRDSGMELKCRFRLIVGLDEESGGRCIARYLKTEEHPACSFSPDANFPLINAEKGILRGYIEKTFLPAAETPGLRLKSIKGGSRYNVVPDEAEALFYGQISADEVSWLREIPNITVTLTDNGTSIRAEGLSAHAMEPQRGKNAVSLLLKTIASLNWGGTVLRGWIEFAAEKFADYYGEALNIATEDEMSGVLTCNLGIIDCSEDKCKISLDIRYPVTKKGEDVISTLNETLKEGGACFTVEKDKKPLFVTPDAPLVKKLLTAYNNITGENGVPESIGGGTYCRYVDNAVSFGPLFPGEIELAHQPNENIPLENLRKITYIYTEALRLFAEG